MKLIIIIGVVLGLIGLIGIATTPINQYINIHKEEIQIPPPIRISFTPEPIKKSLEVEKYPEIRNFLNNLPDCKWCIACSSYSYYTRTMAEKQNINIHEITLTTLNNSGLNIIKYGDGHRINFFYADDGHRVYIDNMYNWGKILEYDKLTSHLKDNFGINTTRIGFKNQK